MNNQDHSNSNLMITNKEEFKVLRQNSNLILLEKYRERENLTLEKTIPGLPKIITNDKTKRNTDYILQPAFLKRNIRKDFPEKVNCKRKSAIIPKQQFFTKNSLDIYRNKINIGKKDEKSTHFKENISKFLENNVYIICMTIITVYALFGYDISLAFFTSKYDAIFQILSTIAFISFLIELFLNSYAKNDYLFSFFFWLDLISTITLIMEIEYIFFPILNTFKYIML